jgi:hypothetical protein
MIGDSFDGTKTTVASQEKEEHLTDEEAQKLAEFEAHIRRGIKQFEAGLGKTFDDKEEFLNYLRNL